MKQLLTPALVFFPAALFSACVRVTGLPIDTTAAWWVGKFDGPIPIVLFIIGLGLAVLTIIFAHEWNSRFWFLCSFVLIGAAFLCFMVADALIIRP
jgi:hypothetical protein